MILPVTSGCVFGGKLTALRYPGRDFVAIPKSNSLLHRTRDRTELADKFVVSYRRYCWPVRSVHDLKLAPFHPLASEGKFHTSRDHRWNMETLPGFALTGRRF